MWRWPLLVVCASMTALGATVVPWEEADDHVGSVVTVEGDVATAATTPEGVLIEFEPGNDRAFRAILLVPLVSGLPRHPERLYLGKRIRATGLVRRWGARPEMVLQTSGQIEVVDLSTPTAPAPAALPSAPVAPASPAPAPAPEDTPPSSTTLPAPAPAMVPPSTPAPEPPARSVAEAVLPALRVDPCQRARARWDEAARAVDARAAALGACLRSGSYRCRQAGAALAPALTDLEWAEQEVEDACP